MPRRGTIRDERGYTEREEARQRTTHSYQLAACGRIPKKECHKPEERAMGRITREKLHLPVKEVKERMNSDPHLYIEKDVQLFIMRS